MSQNIILNEKYGITLSVLDNGLGIVHNNGHEKIYLNKDISGFMYHYQGRTFNISSIPKVFNIDKVENMSEAFDCWWDYGTCLVGSPFCGNNVTNMAYSYFGCLDLTGSPVCSDSVIDFSGAYNYCENLTGLPVCGNNVINMVGTYYCCGLTGSPVCGNNVINMCYTYSHCYDMIGSPVCGYNVLNMYGTYSDCHNLIGSPVCGNNVTDMSYAYSGCHNLIGSPVCGNNVTNMVNAYSQCPNLYGDMYCYNTSTGSINMQNCFYGRNTQNRLNIHVVAGSKFDTTLHGTSYNGRIYGDYSSLTWVDDPENHCYYNLGYNTWVYNNL